MNSSRPNRRRFIFLVAILLVVLLGSAVTSLHFSAISRFAEVKAVAEQIEVPTGSVLLEESGEGNGLEAYACIDTYCPGYDRVFAVAVQPGTEMQTLRGLLETNGHRVTNASSDSSCARQGDWNPICYAEGVTDDLLVSVGIQFPTEQWHDWVPQHTPPPGTEWRRLTVGVADY